MRNRWRLTNRILGSNQKCLKDKDIFRILKVMKIGTIEIHWKKKAENLEEIESLKLKKVKVCSKEIRNIWRVNTIGTGVRRWGRAFNCVDIIGNRSVLYRIQID